MTRGPNSVDGHYPTLWCTPSESNRALRVFSAALSPVQLGVLGDPFRNRTGLARRHMPTSERGDGFIRLRLHAEDPSRSTGGAPSRCVFIVKELETHVSLPDTRVPSSERVHWTHDSH